MFFRCCCCSFSFRFCLFVLFLRSSTFWSVSQYVCRFVGPDVCLSGGLSVWHSDVLLDSWLALCVSFVRVSKTENFEMILKSHFFFISVSFYAASHPPYLEHQQQAPLAFDTPFPSSAPASSSSSRHTWYDDCLWFLLLLAVRLTDSKSKKERKLEQKYKT